MSPSFPYRTSALFGPVHLDFGWQRKNDEVALPLSQICESRHSIEYKCVVLVKQKYISCQPFINIQRVNWTQEILAYWYCVLARSYVNLLSARKRLFAGETSEGQHHFPHHPCLHALNPVFWVVRTLRVRCRGNEDFYLRYFFVYFDWWHLCPHQRRDRLVSACVIVPVLVIAEDFRVALYNHNIHREIYSITMVKIT